MLTRSLIVAGAFVSAAVAQCSSSANITSQSDLDRLSSCEKFDGDLTITGDAATLVLNGVQEITGSLTANNATLTSLSAPDLETIGDSLTLSLLTNLNTLSMPKLTKAGSIDFLTLPALRQMQFNAGVQEASNIRISDTQLQSLDGLNLSQVDNFNVNNNRYISDITVAVTSVTNLLDISFNSQNVNVSLPDLKWANNATFQFCASVYMPSLESVNQSLGFINNTIYSLNFNNLTEIGQSLSIVSNSKLSNLSFSALETIGGGFQIANNTNLRAITGFNSVKRVGGAIDFVGNFSQASLPSLDDVEGGVTVESSGDLDCDSFDEAHSSGDFHGDHYLCKGATTTASYTLSGGSSTSATGGSSSGSAATASSSGSSGSSSSSSSKNNAVAAIPASGVFGGVSLLLLSLL